MHSYIMIPNRVENSDIEITSHIQYLQEVSSFEALNYVAS